MGNGKLFFCLYLKNEKKPIRHFAKKWTNCYPLDLWPRKTTLTSNHDDIAMISDRWITSNIFQNELHILEKQVVENEPNFGKAGWLWLWLIMSNFSNLQFLFPAFPLPPNSLALKSSSLSDINVVTFLVRIKHGFYLYISEIENKNSVFYIYFIFIKHICIWFMILRILID